MDERTPKPSREERLAAQLRANLRRRKAQARALAEQHELPSDASQNDPA